MTPSHVSKLCEWYGVNEYELFTEAYRWKYQSVCWDLEECVKQFNRGEVPHFVVQYIKTVLYHRLLVWGTRKQLVP